MKPPNRQSIAFVVLMGVLTTSPASAQQPDSVRADSIVALRGLRVDVARLRAGVIPIAAAPFPVDIADRAAIDRAHHTVAEVLEVLPGVTLGDQVDSPFQPDLRLRGFTASPVVGLPQSVSVFLDGVRVNEADASQVHFNLLPMRDIERVELVRGPVGAFGKNTLAGALNLVTRRGSGAPGGELELFGGAFGELGGSVLVSGEGSGFDFYVRGSYRRMDGWRMRNHASQMQGFAKVGRRGATTDAWLSYTFSADSIEGPQALPASWLDGGVLPVDVTSVPRDRRRLQYTGGNGDYFTPRLHFVNTGWEHRASGAVTLRASAYARFVDFDQFNDNITEPDALGLTGINSVGGTGQLTVMAGPNVRFSGGVDLARNDVDIEILELPNRAYPDLVRATTELAGTVENNLGVYSDLFWQLDGRSSLYGSLRFDYVDLPFEDRLDPENDGENVFEQLTGSIGASRALGNATRLFASYARGFRAPVVLEITCADPEDPCPLPFELGADPPLDPVTTDTWQLGARTRGSGSSANITAFWSEVRNDLFSVVDPEIPTRGFFTNLDRTRRVGVEGAITLSEMAGVPGASVTASAGWTRATFETVATLAAPFLGDDDTEEEGDEGDPEVVLPPPTVGPGDRFPLIPELAASATLTYARGEYQAELTGNYVGPRFLVGDEGNEEAYGKLSGYALLDLDVRRTMGAATVYTEVRNLLDRRYDPFGLISPNVRGPETDIERFHTPGLPRRMLVGVRVSLR